MKKICYIVISLTLLTSCKDLLNTAPGNQIASGNMWTSEVMADEGMNGLYKNFYVKEGTMEAAIAINQNVSGYFRSILMGLEYQSCAYEAGLNRHLTDTPKRGDRDYIKYEWQWCYTGIHRINDALENLHRAGLSEEKYERYICEARFLRAWYYSRLNMLFQGVPLYLNVISTEECTKGQSTSEEVWQAVIDDLTYCIENRYCPDNTLTTNYGRPSKGAAYSLRGMAYMWLAWQNGEDASYYQLAVDDFEKVPACGYGLWTGNYMDMFHYKYERNSEMIFPIQFTEDEGYCDYLEVITAARDCYHGWSSVRPTYDFVNDFQNADGSKFEWTKVIPEWNDDVFQNDLTKREVFFFRDSVSLDSNNNVVQDYWSSTEAATIQERVNAIGADVFNKYYLKDGNEARCRSIYENRDPRLKDLVITPYEPYDCYCDEYNNAEQAYGKEFRWPYVRDNKGDYQDMYTPSNNGQPSMYSYKKYAYNMEGDLIDRLRCPTDWPLIRYTDIYLHLAECYVHLGRLSEAASIVNEIRARVGMPNITVGSSDDVMEAVRYERRVELCLETHDWFDEWRWGTYKEKKFAGKDMYGPTGWWGQYENYIRIWYYTDNMYPWGPPQEECQRNPNITPADGWYY